MKKSIKAWALVITKHAGKGNLMGSLHDFYPYKHVAESERNERHFLYRDSLKSIPVQITYTLPTKTKRK